MRAIWKGFISFGLVTIPVGIGNAQQRRDVSFRNLSRESMVPVRQKRWDPVKDVEVGAEDLVKGYEVSKGRFVTVEDDELARFAAKQERTIEILEFVDADQVDAVFYEKTYWVEPQERAERPYALLLQAMERSGRAAIGRFVLSTKEHLVLLRPMNGALAIETLYYVDDLRLSDQREIAERVAAVEVKEEELAMADQLIAALTHEFDASKYRNETREALVAFLEAKADGQAPVIAEDVSEPAPVVDLMAALKASLAGASGASPATAADEEAPAKPAAKRTARSPKKDQLSIDEAKLRGIEGAGEDSNADASKNDAVAPRTRKRRAS